MAARGGADALGHASGLRPRLSRASAAPRPAPAAPRPQLPSPKRASIARRICGGSVGQASTIRTRSASGASWAVSWSGVIVWTAGTVRGCFRGGAVCVTVRIITPAAGDPKTLGRHPSVAEVPAMTARFPLSATLAVVLAASFPAVAADGVSLRWRFAKGQELKYLLRHKEVRTIEIGDHTFETTTTSEYDLQWTVVEVDERGTATLAQKLTALRVTISGKDFEFEYDSARGNQSDDEYKRKLIALYDQLRFADYQLEIEATGRVRRVQGFDRLLGEVADRSQQADFHAL